MAIYFSLFVALLGVLAYGFATNGKVQEIGRVSYFAGLLAFLLRGAERLFQVIGP